VAEVAAKIAESRSQGSTSRAPAAALDVWFIEGGKLGLYLYLPVWLSECFMSSAD
jgi:hypothetical protein